MRSIRPFAVAALLTAIPTPTLAQSAPDISANVGIVSDYRFRGLSLSDRKPALQAGADADTDRFFVGAWASTIADYSGADVELDLYGGVHGSLGSIGYRVGAYAYLYPGGSDVNYVEMVAEGERAVGPVTLGVQAAFAPRQDNVTSANHYLAASAALEVGAGVTATMRAGYEDGFYEGKWDWEVGASYTLAPVTASIAYVDTNYSAPDEAGRLGRGAVIGTLTASF
jgi:uncharacterized protein (TIGR02001 family)